MTDPVRPPVDTILIIPDPKQEQGIHRLRISAHHRHPQLFICESLVNGMFVVMNRYGLVLHYVDDGKPYFAPIGNTV